MFGKCKYVFGVYLYDKLQFIGQLYHKNWKGHDGGFLNRPVLKMGGFDTPILQEETAVQFEPPLKYSVHS